MSYVYKLITNIICMEKTILLKYLKIYLDIDLKIILLNYQTIKINRKLMDEECCKKL